MRALIRSNRMRATRNDGIRAGRAASDGKERPAAHGNGDAAGKRTQRGREARAEQPEPAAQNWIATVDQQQRVGPRARRWRVRAVHCSPSSSSILASSDFTFLSRHVDMIPAIDFPVAQQKRSGPGFLSVSCRTCSRRMPTVIARSGSRITRDRTRTGWLGRFGRTGLPTLWCQKCFK